MNKSGVSTVVAITFVLLLTILAVTILFTLVLPSINDNLEEVTSERVSLSIETEGGYTVWDEETQVALVQVRRGDDNLNLETLKFRFYRGEKELEKTNLDSNNEPIPEPGQIKTYGFDLFAYNFGKPELIRVFAVVNGVEQEVSDEVGTSAEKSLPDSSAETTGSEIFSKYLVQDEELPMGDSYLELLRAHESWNESANGCYNTSVEPYPVCTCVDLNRVRNNLDKNHILEFDIDFETCKTYFDADYTPTGISWEPIGSTAGSETNPFWRTFNGQGNTISNLYVNKPDSDFVGLFAYSYKGPSIHGTFKNLTVEGVVIGEDHVGGIVGDGTKSDFINCVFNGNVSGSKYNSKYIAGLVGYGNMARIKNSHTSGFVYTDYQYAGGITGSTGYEGTYGYIINSSSSSVVSGGAFVGGLVASGGTQLTNSSFTGTVNSEGNYAGGLIAYLRPNGLITDSNSTGKIYCGGEGLCGGIVGYNEGTFAGSNTWTNHADDSATGCIGTIEFVDGTSIANCTP